MPIIIFSRLAAKVVSLRACDAHAIFRCWKHLCRSFVGTCFCWLSPHQRVDKFVLDIISEEAESEQHKNGTRCMR